MAVCCPTVCATSASTKRPYTSLKGVLSALIEQMEYLAALLDVTDDSDPELVTIIRGLAKDIEECKSISGTPEAYSYVLALLSLTQNLLQRLFCYPLPCETGT